jgi:hypothetical protein
VRVVAAEEADARDVGRVGRRERPLLGPPLVQLGERVVDPALDGVGERERAVAVVAERAGVAAAEQLCRLLEGGGVAREGEAPRLVSLPGPSGHEWRF